MKHVTSRDNAEFKAIRRLAQSARERQRSGKTLLDGLHLIHDWEASFGPVETLIVSASALDDPAISGRAAGRATLVLSDTLFREAAVVETPAGVMAVVAIPPAAQPQSSGDTVLLDGIQDPGNVGTLIRTAAAAGVKQVLLSPDCAGVWSPRVLRAGQGAHCSLTVVEDVDLPAFIAAYHGTVAITALDGATALYACDLRAPMAWVFGSEGAGVRPEVSAMAGLRVRIPMPGRVESLNVAAAAAVCLFESVRQRACSGEP